jgi:peptidoglycan/xylan/chitin deacetylase (PgdA/CDA1 family)
MTIRSFLSALKVLLGLTTKLNGSDIDKAKYIPKEFKAVCLISADYEQAWAFLHSRQNRGKAVELGLKTRLNIPKILDMCDKYDVPITWATVGHLFLDSCFAENGIKHSKLKRIPYFENRFWKYQDGDWYDTDPCSDLQSNPAFYGSDIVRDILNRKVKHEIACHTFSHIDCSDDVCPVDVFDKEISECKTMAEQFGLSLQSFVHPGHLIGHLDELSKCGFESFRSNNGDTLGFPAQSKTGLWELKNTAELVYNNSWPAWLNRLRYRRIIDKALKKGKVIVFWFHPSFDEVTISKTLEPVFSYLYNKKQDIWTTTHQEYTTFLNSGGR